MSTSTPTPSTISASQNGMSVLHRQHHGHLRLNRAEPDFGFARHAVTVVLSAPELPAACTEFPCVMAHQPDGSWSLLAVTGLQAGHNLFISPEGAWLGQYLPATLESWPFRLVREGAQAGSFVIAVHTPSLSETVGDPLFDAQGGESPWLLERLRQLVQTDAALLETSQQVAALHEAGVLVERSLQAVLADGRDVELTGFMTVDESRLLELSADTVHRLHTQGALSLAYLHLLSLRRFRPLVLRAGQPSSAH